MGVDLTRSHTQTPQPGVSGALPIVPLDPALKFNLRII